MTPRSAHGVIARLINNYPYKDCLNVHAKVCSSCDREREGEEEARRQLEQERKVEEKKVEVEEELDKEDKEENDEEEARSLGSESYTTAASSLSYNVCKICHCGGEVLFIIFFSSKCYRASASCRKVSQPLSRPASAVAVSSLFTR